MVDESGESKSSALREINEYYPLLEMENITFGYQKLEPPLKTLILQYGPGKWVAFVGGSGSGKSTIAS